MDSYSGEMQSFAILTMKVSVIFMMMMFRMRISLMMLMVMMMTMMVMMMMMAMMMMTMMSRMRTTIQALMACRADHDLVCIDPWRGEREVWEAGDIAREGFKIKVIAILLVCHLNIS